MTGVSAALIYIQIPPRFLLFRSSYYGWPFVHFVRHVEVVTNEPPEIYYFVFVPGALFDLLVWTVLIVSVVMVLKSSRRSRRAALQIYVNTMLWLLTAVAVLLALYRADPCGFWVLNRILRVEPRWIQGMLLFGLGCIIYVAGRAVTQLSWEALAPPVSRIAGNLRRWAAP